MVDTNTPDPLRKLNLMLVIKPRFFL